VPTIFGKSFGDYSYAAALGKNAAANAAQTQQVMQHIQELQNQIKMVAESKSNQQISDVFIESAKSFGQPIQSPQQSRWETKTNKEGIKTNQVNVGSINFNTYQVNTDNPAEKDKYRRYNELQVDNAKELNKNLDKLIKQNNKKVDQDTAIKKKYQSPFSKKGMEEFFRKQKQNISEAVKIKCIIL